MIRVGIVGTGGMGTVHYTNYQYIEECQVAAVCGNSEKAEKWGDWLFRSYRNDTK